MAQLFLYHNSDTSTLLWNPTSNSCYILPSLVKKHHKLDTISSIKTTNRIGDKGQPRHSLTCPGNKHCIVPRTQTQLSLWAYKAFLHFVFWGDMQNQSFFKHDVHNDIKKFRFEHVRKGQFHFWIIA